MEPTSTIGELKELYWQDDRNYCSNIVALSDGRDFIVKGRVVSSDSTGNIFKNVVIQDNSGAITIAINAYDLYATYQYGQEVVVNCTGLQIGGYNGLMQLGSEGTYNGSPSMTFMTSDDFAAHAETDGLPEPSKITPAIFTIEQLKAALSDPATKREYMSRLVTIENVSFETPGQKFAPTASTDRYVKDEAGNKLNIRCSSYATWKDEVIPSGSGSVTGILSFYGTDWQMQLNDLKGLVGFTPYDPSLNPVEPAKGDGTVDDPYNVAKALEVCVANGETSSTMVYTAGYVVSGSIDTSYGNATWDIADTKDGNTTLKVFRVKDFGGEKFTNADKVKVGDYIVVYAPLINYKGNTPETGDNGQLYSINGELAGTPTTPTEPTEPGDVPDGEGTEASPYNVGQIIALNPQGNKDNPDATDIWVKGYIVGWADMSSVYYINAETARFNSEATLKTNILVAPSKDVTDVSQCIGIQLPSGAVRNALNLQDNPDNLGRLVSIKGNLSKYSGVAGITNASAYLFDGEAPAPEVEPAGDGTEASPYNIAKAYEVCIATGETATSEEFYIAGYVMSGSIDATYGNGTWVVADTKEGSAKTITFFRVKDFGGEKFTDANKVKVGDYLVVKAPLVNYKGNTPETNYGTLISINGAKE
ncbi:MAG: DUF5689 domain-containing protein [Lachnospiraceae bacterium]|nr:DUF5689 domain-containing protein [Lachnospiraceae bacterium]